MLRNNPLLFLNKKSFSLLEVLIVLVIISALAAIAFVNYGMVIERAKAKEIEKAVYVIGAAIMRDAVEKDWKYTALPDLNEYTTRLTSDFIQSTTIGLRQIDLSKGYFVVYIGRKGAGVVSMSYSFASSSDTWSTGGLYAIWLVINRDDHARSLKIQCSDGNQNPGICHKLGY